MALKKIMACKPIYIYLKAEDGCCVLTIGDNGIGMPEDLILSD